MFLFSFSELYKNWFIINLPTLLICFIFLISVLFGLIWGSRKSRIMFIHTIIGIVVCSIIFVILTKKFSDDTIIGFVNSFIPNNTIQGLIGVSSEASTCKDIIIEVIRKQNINVDLEPIMPYIMAMATAMFRFVCFILCYVVYLVLMILLYIIYFIFYPQRRYKKKINRKAQLGIGKPYRKKPAIGLIYGIIRGLIGTFIFASFVGSFFFIVSSGSEKIDEYIENPNNDKNIDYQNTYYMFRNYSKKGIFGILNKARNDDDIPYYLFFSNAITKGKVKTEEGSVDFSLNGELASYMSIVNQMFDLAAKYGFVDDLLNGNTDAIINGDALKNEEFYNDLNAIVDNFKTPEFTFVLLKNCLDTMSKDYKSYLELAHINQNDKNMDMIMEICDSLFVSEDAIKISTFVKDSDIRLMLHAGVTALLTYKTSEAPSDDATAEVKASYQLNLAAELMTKIIPDFEKLSLFNDTDVQSTFNLAMKKITNVATKYVKITISDNNYSFTDLNIPSDIDWGNELVTFLNVGSEVLGMLADNNVSFTDKNSYLQMFNKNNGHYNDNIIVLDDFGNKLGDSKLLSSVFESDFVYDFLENTIAQSLKIEGVKIPRDVKFANSVDSSGNKISGEFTKLIDLMEALVDNGLIDKFNKPEGESFTLTDFVDVLDGDNVNKCIGDSTLAYYLVSSALLNVNLEGVSLYTPDSVLTTHVVKEESYTLIVRDEIRNIISGLSSLLPILDSSSAGFDISSVLDNADSLKTVKSSVVLSGTMVKFLVDNFANMENSPIVFPNNLDLNVDANNMDNWLKENGEFDKIIDILENEELKNVISKVLNNEKVSTSLFTNISDAGFDAFVASDIMYYSVCNLMTTSLAESGVNIVIPDCAYQDVSEKLISKNELKELKNDLKILMPEDGKEFDVNSFIENSNIVKESDILHATVVNYLANETNNQIKTPAKYKSSASIESLKADFHNNIWYTSDEVSKIFTAVKALNIDFNNLNDMDASSMANKITSIANPDDVFMSIVIRFTISDSLLNSTSMIKVPSSVIEEVDNEKYIKQAELTNLVTAFKTFGDVDFNNFDINIVRSLMDKNDSSVLDKNANDIYTSAIATYSLTDVLNTTSAIKVPGCVYEIIASGFAEERVTKTEFKKLIKSANALGTDANLDNINVDTIIHLSDESLDDLFGSDILRYTITDMVKNQVNVPAGSNEIIGTRDEITYNAIKALELKNLINGIEALGVTDFNNFDANTVINNKEIDLDTILNSEIIHFVISTKLKEMNSDVIIPKIVLSTIYEENEVVTKTEVKSLIEGVWALDIDLDNFDSTAILNKNDDEIDTILNSNILLYTISNKLSNISNIVIPDKVKMSDSFAENYIEKAEIKNAIKGINALGITNFNTTIDTNIVLQRSDTEINTMLNSMIIHATISDKILKVTEIDIPTNAKKDDTLGIDGAILKAEISNLFKSIKALNLTDINEFNANTVLNMNDESLNTMLNSMIIHYTISNKLVTLEGISIPAGAYDNTLGEKAITSSEIKNAINGVKAFGITDFSSNLDANKILKMTDKEIDTIINSMIIHYTISGKIRENVSVPNAYITNTELSSDAITKTELKTTIISFKSLNMEEINYVDASVLNNDDLNTNILFASAIVRYELSSSLLDLTNLITIPSGVYEIYSEAYPTEKGITTDELCALVSGAKALGINFNDTSSISTTSLSKDNTSTAMNSKILQYTISNKIIAINSLVVPASIYNTLITGYEEKAITSEEIVKLVGDFNSMNISLDSTAKFKQDTVKAEIFINGRETSSILVASVSKVVAENLSIYEDDANISKDYLNKDVMILSQANIYTLLNEFNAIGVDFSDTSSADYASVLLKLKNGNIDIYHCSNIAWLFIAELCEKYPLAGSFEHKSVNVYLKKELTLSNGLSYLTRKGIDDLANSLSA